MNRQNWAFFSYCSYVLSTLYDPSHPFNDLLKWVYIPIFIPILQRKQVRPKKRWNIFLRLGQMEQRFELKRLNLRLCTLVFISWQIPPSGIFTWTSLIEGWRWGDKEPRTRRQGSLTSSIPDLLCVCGLEQVTSALCLSISLSAKQKLGLDWCSEIHPVNVSRYSPTMKFQNMTRAFTEDFQDKPTVRVRPGCLWCCKTYSRCHISPLTVKCQSPNRCARCKTAPDVLFLHWHGNVRDQAGTGCWLRPVTDPGELPPSPAVLLAPPAAAPASLWQCVRVCVCVWVCVKGMGPDA